MADKRLTYELTTNDRASAGFAKVAAEASGSANDISKAYKKSSDDSKTHISALTAAIAGVAPAAVPIGAVAVGAIAGLGATAVVAGLGILGIRDAMKSGSALGREYEAAFKPITGEFQTLKSIAAANMFDGINAGIKGLQPLFPQLNADTAVLSSQIGEIAGHTGPALAALFHDLNPLFTSLGGDLVDGAAKFQHWAQSSDSVSKFVQYAQDQLPAVEHTLGALVTTVVHVIEAFAPLGGGTLRAIGAVADAINAIPIGVLQAAAPLITGTVLALKGMQIATAVAGWVEGLSTKLVGLGVAESSVAAGAAGFAATLGPVAGVLTAGYFATQMYGNQLNSLSNSYATGRVMAQGNADDLTSLQYAYQGVSGIIHSQANPAMLDFVTSGKLTGQGIGDISDKTAALLPHLSAMGVSMADVKAGIGGNDQAFQQLIATVQAHGGVTEQDITTLRSLHGVFADVDAAGQRTSGTISGLTDKQRKLADQTLSATGQLNIMSGALDALSGNAVNAAQIELQLKDALGTTRDHFAAARAQAQQYGTTLDEDTAKGRANREWMLNQIQTVNQHAVAVGKQTGSVKQATAALGADEAQLRAAALAAGFNTQQVDALIKKYAATPKQVATKITADTNQALGAMSRVLAYQQALHDKQITITTYIQDLILPTVRTYSGSHDSRIPGHASGGYLSEGWNTAGEGSATELLYKQGSTVKVLTNDQSKPILNGPGGGVTVQVNVRGSVIAQGDLIREIQAGVALAQKRAGGKVTIYGGGG